MKLNVKTTLLFTTALALLALPAVLSKRQPEAAIPVSRDKPRVDPAKNKKARIQVALLLDTSSSMDGLIDQAKSQLWRIANEVAAAKRSGERPEVEIALYEYGKASLPAATGFIRRILPFTTDLDKVSEELFALTTNGGDEYCGMVIDVATRQLAWSEDESALKLIFIAGNEPFTQGSVDYRESIAAAHARGITVNTIFCGPEAEGAATGWKDGAVLADGRYMSIDQNRLVVHVDAPQDAEIAALGAKMNETYIPYGAFGRASYERQSTQDANAMRVKQGAMISRSMSKASAAYDNSGWDLIDAINNRGADLKKIDAKELPEGMRTMSEAEREKYVAEKAKEREQIRKRIQELTASRTRFVTAEMKKRNDAGAETLDKAMIEAIHESANRRGFTFPSAAR
jgi:hypothetical protein